MLDTSASMRGAGGSANIFGKVKDAISEFIRNARDGDTVTLYTFDRDTTLRSHIRISGEIDKRDLLKSVTDLSAEGDKTYTGKAIRDALERALELKERPDAANRTISIVLFTDGLEDVRGITNPISIPSTIALLPKDQPYVFFVSVGVQAHETQLENFVKDPAMGNRGEVIRDPGATGIAEVGERIRKTVEAPPQPRSVRLTAYPSKLDFGNIEPGETSSQTIRVTSDLDCRLRVAIDDPKKEGLSITEPNEIELLKAGQEHSLEVRLTAQPDLDDGPRNVMLALTAAPTDSNLTGTTVLVEAALNVVSTPLWRTILNYFLLLLLLLAIILACVSAIKGEPPWIWLPTVFKRATLEGELQVLYPRPARAEDEFISLTQLRAKKISLSSLIPSGTTDDSDADLEAISQNGKVSVKLERIKGNVYVNKVEVANTRIYNDDVIELGGTKLLFSSVNQERPVKPEGEEEF